MAPVPRRFRPRPDRDERVAAITLHGEKATARFGICVKKGLFDVAVADPLEGPMALLANRLDMPACKVTNAGVINFQAHELLRMLDDARLALAANPESAPQIAQGFFKRIALSPAAESVEARGGLAPWQKRKVERYLQDNLEHSICMNELAKEARLSVSHFCRSFKKSFGDTPHAYVIRLRLELARKLMLTTDEPLSQIALSCGLADQAHLSKLFRRVFADTPNAWRRRNFTETHRDPKHESPAAAMYNAA